MTRLAKDVILTETENGTALLDERSGRYFISNGSAAIVLGAIAEHATVRDAVSAVSAAYPDVDTAAVEADVRTLVDHLCREGLVSS